MRTFLILLCTGLLVASCGTSRYAGTSPIIGHEEESVVDASAAESIINYAMTFEGTRYKYGGTDANGMDCSGLVYTSFQQQNINLPRISREMATQGVPVSLKDVEKGDLLFFQTSRKRNVVTHVGLVVEVGDGLIKFIHSTTRLGVIVSSMDESYWKNAFLEGRRII